MTFGPGETRRAAPQWIVSERDVVRVLATRRAAPPGEDPGVGPADVAPRAHAMLEDPRCHDPLTRAHSERVRGLADVIGASLGLTAPEREKLRVASLLHDIGKLAVPRHILNKRDEPTDAEWEVLRTHPDSAERLLSPIRPWLGEWVGAATEHHERFDGGGYPRGLAQEEITLAGRIVAVADPYDCIVSTRSYKAAIPPEQARAELAASSGAQFDPEIVRALLAVAIHRLHPSRS